MTQRKAPAKLGRDCEHLMYSYTSGTLVGWKTGETFHLIRSGTWASSGWSRQKKVCS